MKRLMLFLALLGTTAVQAQHTFTVTVTNPQQTPRTDAPVVVSLTPYGAVRQALVMSDGQEIPSQLDDLDQDEQMDELCFLADLKGGQARRYTVTLSAAGEPRTYPARVYAEMLMRNDKVKEKNRHNNYISSIITA